MGVHERLHQTDERATQHTARMHTFPMDVFSNAYGSDAQHGCAWRARLLRRLSIVSTIGTISLSHWSFACAHFSRFLQVL